LKKEIFALLREKGKVELSERHFEGSCGCLEVTKKRSPSGKGRKMRERYFACRLMLILGFLATSAGCISWPVGNLTESRNFTETQVFLKPAFITHQKSKLLIYPFSHPQYSPGTGHRVTHEFYQELLRSDLYREIVLSTQISSASKETLIQPELKDFDLAMRGKIVHLLAGSGGTPSQLTVEIQIMSVVSGAMIWFVRLDGTSESGADLDFVWRTYPGQGAQPYQALARALAQQLVGVMTPPPETEGQVVPPKSPLNMGTTGNEG
jgi:hypothetical protein